MASRSDWVAHLGRYTLAELRRRQCITAGQIKTAWQLMQCPDTRARGESAMIDLRNMYDSLTEAVMIKCGYLEA
jgi:hypothetical protein